MAVKRPSPDSELESPRPDKRQRRQPRQRRSKAYKRRFKPRLTPEERRSRFEKKLRDAFGPVVTFVSMRSVFCTLCSKELSLGDDYGISNAKVHFRRKHPGYSYSASGMSPAAELGTGDRSNDAVGDDPSPAPAPNCDDDLYNVFDDPAPAVGNQLDFMRLMSCLDDCTLDALPAHDSLAKVAMSVLQNP